MARKNRHHVLIAGAGPAGLAAALFLEQKNLDVEIVDGRWRPPGEDVSVVLHPDTFQRLRGLGLAFDLERDAHAVDTLAVYDRGRRTLEVPLCERGAGWMPAAVLPLWRLQERLEAALADRGVAVHWHRRLARLDTTAERVVAEVDVLDRDGAGYAIAGSEGVVVRTQRREPAFLVAADGRDSLARTQLRVPWREVGDAETIAAFEVDTDLDPGREVDVLLDDDVCTVWPRPGGGARLTFHLRDAGALAPKLARGDAPDADDLAMLVRTRVPWLDARFGAVRWSHLERTAPAIAERPGFGRVWFVGDAAVALVPSASQALNHGLREADDLAAVMSLVVRDRAAPRLLDEHGLSSQAAALRATRIASCYRPGAGASSFVAGAFARILPMVPAASIEIDEIAHHLGLERVG